MDRSARVVSSEAKANAPSGATRGPMQRSLLALAAITMLTSPACRLFFGTPGDEIPARGDKLECFIDVRPQGMAGVSAITLSSRGPEFLAEDGTELLRYHITEDCRVGLFFDSIEAIEDDWRLQAAARVGGLVDEGDPAFDIGVEWCQVPDSLTCQEREPLEFCAQIRPSPLIDPLPICDPPPDPFGVTCDDAECDEILFGDVEIGLAETSAPRREVIIKNVGPEGSVEMTINYDGALTPADGPDPLAAFDVEDNECLFGETGVVLQPGANTCRFSVVFQPTEAGDHRAIIPLTYSYPDDQGTIQGARSIPIDGRGVEAPSGCIDVTCVDGTTCQALDFQAVDLDEVSSAETVTITNCGSAGAPDVLVSYPPDVVPPNTAFVVSPGSCFGGGNETLAPGDPPCSFEVTFEPTTTAAQNGTMNLDYQFTGSAPQQSHQTQLAGVGDGRGLRLTPQVDVCFQDVLPSGCTDPQDLTLANVGTEDVTIDCIGTDPAQCPGYPFGAGFEGGLQNGTPPPFLLPLPFTLAPGQQQTVTLRWCDGVVPAPQAEVVSIRSNDLTQPEITITVERRITCP